MYLYPVGTLRASAGISVKGYSLGEMDVGNDGTIGPLTSFNGQTKITLNVIYFQLYWLGPLLGAAAAAWIYDFVFAVNATPNKIAGFFSKDYDDAHYGRQGRTAVDTNKNGTELQA